MSCNRRWQAIEVWSRLIPVPSTDTRQLDHSAHAATLPGQIQDLQFYVAVTDRSLSFVAKSDGRLLHSMHASKVGWGVVVNQPLLDKMKPGSRVVSHQFEIPGVPPDKAVMADSTEDGAKRTLYLWTLPLKKASKLDAK